VPGTKFLVHQVWAIWFIVRRWIWDSDMLGALVADEMGLSKSFTSVAAGTICKPLTEKVVMGLPLSIVWGNSLEELVNMAQNDEYKRRLRFLIVYRTKRGEKSWLIYEGTAHLTQRPESYLMWSCRARLLWAHTWN